MGPRSHVSLHQAARTPRPGACCGGSPRSGPILGGTPFLDSTISHSTAMHTRIERYKAVSRSPQQRGQSGCACGLRAGHTRRAPARPRAAPCGPAAVQHHQPRSGSARRTVLWLVRCQAALRARALVLGKLCGAARVEGASTCLATADPDAREEHGMASDVKKGKGKADDGGRAHLRRHLYRQS